jgi:hypothetical protein
MAVRMLGRRYKAWDACRARRYCPASWAIPVSSSAAATETHNLAYAAAKDACALRDLAETKFREDLPLLTPALAYLALHRGSRDDQQLAVSLPRILCRERGYWVRGRGMPGPVPGCAGCLLLPLEPAGPCALRIDTCTLSPLLSSDNNC